MFWISCFGFPVFIVSSKREQIGPNKTLTAITRSNLTTTKARRAAKRKREQQAKRPAQSTRECESSAKNVTTSEFATEHVKKCAIDESRDQTINQWGEAGRNPRPTRALLSNRLGSLSFSSWYPASLYALLSRHSFNEAK